jgi:hypothetical protein
MIVVYSMSTQQTHVSRVSLSENPNLVFGYLNLLSERSESSFLNNKIKGEVAKRNLSFYNKTIFKREIKVG